MDIINELIEAMMLDTGLEGVGATAGVGLLWGCFFGGTFVLFQNLLELLADTI